MPITFEVWENNDELSFVITDTGEGFSDEALKHATEQFFMDDDSKNSKSNYGIGLSDTGGAKVTIRMPVCFFDARKHFASR